MLASALALVIVSARAADVVRQSNQRTMTIRSARA